MILIAHRGNIFEKNTAWENSPEYIDKALELGYHVEIDIWSYKNNLYLGHDEPQYKINLDFLDNPKLYVHCKNSESLEYMNSLNLKCDYFWHEKDQYTITSKNIIWVYPKIKLLKNSIAVLPELDKNQDLTMCCGICSDFISDYKFLSN